MAKDNTEGASSLKSVKRSGTRRVQFAPDPESENPYTEIIHGSSSPISVTEVDEQVIPKQKNDRGKSPLHFAVESQDNIEAAIDKIFEGKSDEEKIRLLKAKDHTENSPLHWAIKMGNERAVSKLLDHIGTLDENSRFELLNNQGRGGKLPLHYAAEEGKTGMIDKLLSAGANIEGVDYLGKKAIHFAAIKGQEKAIGKLLSSGADLESRDDEGKTALHYAAEKGQENAVMSLIYYGADLEARDQEGKTSLHVAVQEGKEGVIEKLSASGADLGARDIRGESVLEVTDKRGRSILHHAVESGEQESIKKLLSSGADLEAKDKDGKTALDKILDSGTLLTAPDSNKVMLLDHIMSKGSKKLSLENAKKVFERVGKELEGSNPKIKEQFMAAVEHRLGLSEKSNLHSFTKRVAQVMGIKTKHERDIMAMKESFMNKARGVDIASLPRIRSGVGRSRDVL